MPRQPDSIFDSGDASSPSFPDVSFRNRTSSVVGGGFDSIGEEAGVFAAIMSGATLFPDRNGDRAPMARTPRGPSIAGRRALHPGACGTGKGNCSCVPWKCIGSTRASQRGCDNKKTSDTCHWRIGSVSHRPVRHSDGGCVFAASRTEHQTGITIIVPSSSGCPARSFRRRSAPTSVGDPAGKCAEAAA